MLLRWTLILALLFPLSLPPRSGEPPGNDPPRSVVLSPYWGPAIRQWEPLIVYWAQERGLDPDLVAAVVRKESIGQAQKEGPYGAVGLMMVMPAEAGFPWRPSAEALKDPSLNLAWGTGILAEIVHKAQGDLALALSAYNGGWDQVHLPSTRQYAQSVLTFYAYAIAGRYGYSYQESKAWTMVLITQVDDRPQEIEVLSSEHYLAPCFDNVAQVYQAYPWLESAPHAVAAHYEDGEGRQVQVRVWVMPGPPGLGLHRLVAGVEATPAEAESASGRPGG